MTSARDAAMPEAPAESVPLELRELVRSERLAQPSGVRTLLHLGVIAAAWAVLASAGLLLDSLVAWIPIWVALAMLTATPLALMHEGVHRNLFGNRSLDQAVSTAAAALIFLHGPAYRAFHLTHHAYTFRPGDSEQLPERFRSRLGYLGYCAVLGPGFVVVLWAGAFATVAGRPPSWVATRRLQRDVRRWAVAPLVVLVPLGVAAVAWPSVVIHVWLVPALLGAVLVFPVLTMPEHYGGGGRKDLVHNTRTSVSNPLLRYVYWNNNFHTAHHLAPTVPPHRIARVDALIAHDNSLREAGFLAFHRRVLSSLPWFARRTDPGPVVEPAADPAPVERVTVENRIGAQHLEALWEVYLESFAPLGERAVLNHLYPRDVFEELVTDSRVFKVVGWKGDRPVALSVVTNVLEIVPQISPAFFARRFPEQSQRHAVFFCVFVCIAEEHRSKTMFPNVMMAIAHIAAERGGVVITDMSRLNREAGIHEAIARTAGRFPDSSFEEIDSQHYFAALLPRPIRDQSVPEPVIDLRDESPADGRDHTTPAAEVTPRSS